MNWVARSIIKAHGILFRNQNLRRIHVDQGFFVNKMIGDIYQEAAERETSVGRALFMRLPDPAANIVLQTYFDPYHLRLDKEGLWLWLENHVLFDVDGRIVVLHDYGSILWKAPDIRMTDILKEG